MTRKLLWNLLLASSLIITLYMAKNVYIPFLSYRGLKEKTLAHIDNWNIIEQGAKFFLESSYHFEKEGITFQGKTTFTTPLYLNTWSANSAKEELSKKTWQVFYNPKNPEKSSLERVFPYKEFIHFFLSFFLSLYFILLKYFLTKRSPVS